jgi:hypothetical protein
LVETQTADPTVSALYEAYSCGDLDASSFIAGLRSVSQRLRREKKTSARTAVVPSRKLSAGISHDDVVGLSVEDQEALASAMITGDAGVYDALDRFEGALSNSSEQHAYDVLKTDLGLW